MARIIAAILLFVPGIICAIGIKLMRDSLFAEVHPWLYHEGIQFIVGLILCIGGLSFVGGFIYHRDRKRQLLKKYKQDGGKSHESS